jgi:L-rhamnose mutarotase
MQVHQGQVEEYRRRHDEVWPELVAVLQDAGVLAYSIFFHPETLQLFAYVEIKNEERWDAIANTEVCRRWWAYMRDIMETNPDSSPRTIALQEVFRFDQEIPF